MRQYRLIRDSPQDGKRNMAVDHAIMMAVESGDSPPTLRLFRWNPPCLSLGQNQTWADMVDMERIQHYGWDVVRRPTGGRAILHTDELTYSLVLPTHHALVESTVVGSYRRISEGLLAALQCLGLQPKADRHSGDATPQNPVCFEASSDYEITTPDGRKLIGSAQVRRKGVVLQHGTLPLYGDVARICDALTYPDEATRDRAKAQVRNRAATLADALDGKTISWEVTADAVVRGFSETFGFEYHEAALSPAEAAHVEELIETIYGNPDRTFRK